MRKNSIDNLSSLRNRNFVQTCAAGFLLYAVIYAVLVPILVHHAMWASGIVFPFLMGMQVVGPFHAWLADKFPRKHLLTYPFIGVLLVAVGYDYAFTAHQFSLLAFIQGGCFGLASSAGITLSIDVVHSGHRTNANMVYALFTRLGMAVGFATGLWLLAAGIYSWMWPVLAGMVGILLASWVYVPFRAPIGLPVCSADRYVLGRAIVPALNVGIAAFACGLLSLVTVWGVASVWMLAVLSPFLVRMFVKLSHHCQRATGNMTFHLWMDAGMMFGIMVGVPQMEKAVPLWLPLLLLGLSVVMYVCVTRIYYRRMRVR